ncbi:hypothetical protein BN1708_000559, partial [Verticillium longisporum]
SRAKERKPPLASPAASRFLPPARSPVWLSPNSS